MNQDQQNSEIAVPFPNSYWVVPGQILAGEYPGDREPQRARKKLVNMLQAGVRVFIDLTHVDNGLAPYHETLREEAEDLGVEVEIYAHPIVDFRTPPPLEMKEILDIIDQVTAQGKIPYIHCWGGIGRTGTVVGCYLVRHGMDGNAALDKLVELRKSTPRYWVVAPESDEQIQMVIEWRIGG